MNMQWLAWKSIMVTLWHLQFAATLLAQPGFVFIEPQAK